MILRPTPLTELTDSTKRPVRTREHMTEPAAGSAEQQGTKTNVVFFTKGVKTENTWIYNARTNIPHIIKNAGRIPAMANGTTCHTVH